MDAFKVFQDKLNESRKKFSPSERATEARILWAYALMDLHKEDPQLARNEVRQILLDAMDSLEQTHLEKDIIMAYDAIYPTEERSGE